MLTAPSSHPACIQTFCLTALKVCHTPADKKYIGWIRGEGRGSKLQSLSLFAPTLSRNVGSPPPPTPPPIGSPAFQSGEEEGTASGQRRVRIHSGAFVSSPTRPGRGGAALVTANGDSGLRTLQVFPERPRGPGLLTPPALHVARRHRWPGLLSPNGLFLSRVSESRTASPAVGSPSNRARRVRTHLLSRAPGPPGGATPGFAVGSAAASCAVGLWASPLLFLGPGVPV